MGIKENNNNSLTSVALEVAEPSSRRDRRQYCVVGSNSNKAQQPTTAVAAITTTKARKVYLPPPHLHLKTTQTLAHRLKKVLQLLNSNNDRPFSTIHIYSPMIVCLTLPCRDIYAQIFSLNRESNRIRLKKLSSNNNKHNGLQLLQYKNAIKFKF